MTRVLTSGAGPGVIALALALLVLTYLLLSPGPARLPRDRRRPPSARPSALTGATDTATKLVDTILRRRGADNSIAAALENAGLTTRVQDFAFLVGIGALVAATIGLLLGGPLLALPLAVSAPLIAKIALRVLASRRRVAFADQLDDSLQLMASSLRAGHSLLQALASVATEAEEPTSTEFARIINETRVGRPLNEALDETAERMGSEDFNWVTQAIVINREVGGNLADVLDGVGHTIRERNQIRRQVKVLAAEGKMSVYVLMALPVGIASFLWLTNPAYLAPFTQSLLGYGLLALSLVMFVIGGVWLRKTARIKF
ncbi:type II secretion system F family protein [Janibacter cremeus]|uniref:type II secretion system F family protein n=1 Tax=Janibacter cremeus TaxID=1285192 RepID=UPI0023F71345|nr:type II secretion system F family protein [Janibacter cremeus]WEV76981.1 type II secretion system F family protein [Janibacter cremeus]